MDQPTQRLHLMAEDDDDLTVISALLQDALVRHSDMTYDRSRRRFAMVVSRFRWELGNGRCERIRAGLHFNCVLNVQHQGIRLATRPTVAELLALRHGPGEDGEAVLTFDFAGGGAVRLVAECIDGELRDLGAPWPAGKTPDHSPRIQD